MVLTWKSVERSFFLPLMASLTPRLKAAIFWLWWRFEKWWAWKDYRKSYNRENVGYDQNGSKDNFICDMRWKLRKEVGGGEARQHPQCDHIHKIHSFFDQVWPNLFLVFLWKSYNGWPKVKPVSVHITMQLPQLLFNVRGNHSEMPIW